MSIVPTPDVGTQTIDLPGLAFTEGISFSFAPNSPVTQLAPGARVLVARNATALAARYGPGLPIAGMFANDTGLSNSGESITLSTPTATIRQFAYDDALPWPSEPDGFGPTLVLTVVHCALKLLTTNSICFVADRVVLRR